jgi:protein-disulfide isomerase
MKKHRLGLWSLNVLTATLMACACTKGPANVAATAAADVDPKTIVATVDGLSITMGELDEHVGAQLRELDEQRYQTRSQGLEQLVSKQLVRGAAAKTKVSEEELLKLEVDGKVKEPSDAEVKEFFEKNAASLPPNSKLEEYRDKIVQFLSRKAHSTRAKDYFAELKQGSKVDILLAPPPKPRFNVEAKGPSRGPQDAKITLVEWSDFECPYCERGAQTIEQVMQRYPGKIRLVFRQFPLTFHAHARKAAEATLCANEQEKFWPMHDALFADQQKLAVADLKATAARLGLDKAKFDACLDGGEMNKVVEADMEAAEKVGVSGTPAFFVNGMMLSGAQKVEEFARLIDAELK